MKPNEFKRGVIVDHLGFFMGAIQWAEDAPTPDVNTKKTRESGNLRVLLTSAEATTAPVSFGKWDAKKSIWLKPTTVRWLADKRGQYAGKRMVWPGREPALADGWEYIPVDPAENLTKARKPIWDGSKWVSPRIVAIVEDNILVNSGIENPRDDQPNIDDITGNGTSIFYPWPELTDGTPARIGATLDPDTGEWAAMVAPKPNPYDIDLSPAQWESMLALTGLDDVRTTVLSALKASDRVAYSAAIKSLNQKRFRFAVLLQMLTQFKPFLPGDVDLSEERLARIWLDEAAS